MEVSVVRSIRLLRISGAAGDVDERDAEIYDLLKRLRQIDQEDRGALPGTLTKQILMTMRIIELRHDWSQGSDNLAPDQGGTDGEPPTPER